MPYIAVNHRVGPLGGAGVQQWVRPETPLELE